MIEIAISSKEHKNGILSEQDLQTALAALRDDGAVILTNAIPLSIITILREVMLGELERTTNRPHLCYNWNENNIKHDPPISPPYLFREILTNEFAIAVTSAILGKGMYNGLYAGNTVLQGALRQPVHVDSAHLWPQTERPHPPYGIVANVPLVDIDHENGSTELWLGSHKEPIVTIQDDFVEIPPSAREQRRKVRPPIQPKVKAGSIILRDTRLWHAGMPNSRPEPRPMLEMVHYASWWWTNPISLHLAAERLLTHPKLRQHANYLANV